MRDWDEIQQRLATRYVVAPPALTFTGIPLDYWREEIRLGCAVSLQRLAAICQQRGADYEKTVEGLK